MIGQTLGPDHVREKLGVRIRRLGEELREMGESKSSMRFPLPLSQLHAAARCTI